MNQQNSKTFSENWRMTGDKGLPRGTEAAEKAIQAIRLKNFHHALEANQRNVDRLLDEFGAKPKSAEDDMRVDSDDVVTHNHYYPPPANPWLKIASAALIASGIGGPLGIVAWKLPEILQALAPTPQQDIWSQYELEVGPPRNR